MDIRRRLARAGKNEHIARVNLELIRKRVRNGFRPFAIRVSDGRRLPVPHPEFIIIGKNIVVVMEKDGTVRIVDALHIVSIGDIRKKRSRA